MAFDPLKKLEQRGNADTLKILDAVRREIVRVKGLIASAKNAQQARNREALYRSIVEAYRELARLRGC